MNEAEFEPILVAAKAGGEWAWRRIYEELAPAIIGFLRARGAADPDDVAGETFVQLVRDLPGFEGDWRGFRAWAFAIARNRMVDAGRRRGRRLDDPVADPAAASPPGGDVVDDAFARLDLERVTEVLDGLSPDQRDVILLRVIGDLSIEEVARVIGKRPGAVKQLQRRGLAAARERLGTEEAAR